MRLGKAIAVPCLLATMVMGVAGVSATDKAENEEGNTPIDSGTLKKCSAPFRSWHYHPDHVIPAKPEIKGFEDVKMVDVPTVFQVLRATA